MHKTPDEMQNIIIFGASGHGSVVLDCIERAGKYRVIGFVDSFQKKGFQINGYSVLGSEYDLPFLIEKYQIAGGIVAIGDNWTRSLVVERISKIVPEFKYISVIHPNASIGKNVHIGAGSVVMPGAIINANAIVGNHCILNTNSSLDHDSFIDNFSSLAPKVCVGGNVILGRASAICLGANVVANISIGEQSVIGAGSLVIRNIPNSVLVYGSPAKLIRKRIASEPYLSGKKNTSPRTTSRVVEKV